MDVWPGLDALGSKGLIMDQVLHKSLGESGDYGNVSGCVSALWSLLLGLSGSNRPETDSLAVFVKVL